MVSLVSYFTHFTALDEGLVEAPHISVENVVFTRGFYILIYFLIATGTECMFLLCEFVIQVIRNGCLLV